MERRGLLRQAAFGGGVDVLAVKAAELLARRGGVQRDVVEHRQNIVLFQKADKLGTFFQILALQIEHMSVVGTLSRDMLQLDLAGFSQRQECLTVAVPAGQAVLVDLVSMQQLSPQVGSVQLAGQVAVTKIHPGVLVHLAAEELGAVGALFAQEILNTLAPSFIVVD